MTGSALTEYIDASKCTRELLSVVYIMAKKVVISRADFEALLERRRHPETMDSADIDPMSQVSSDFRALHARTGAPLPDALRPSRESIEADDRAAQPLTPEMEAEVAAEFAAFLAEK